MIATALVAAYVPLVVATRTYLSEPLGAFGLALERSLVARIAAAANADHRERQRHSRIGESEIERRARAHRATDDVRFLHFQVAHHDGDVIDCKLVGIARY